MYDLAVEIWRWHPRVLGRIPASQASSAVGAAHDREHLAITGGVDVRCDALQYVSAFQQAQRSDAQRRTPGRYLR
jgi:hypothetical protein